MGLQLEGHDVREVAVVDVSVDPEQPLEYHSYDFLEIAREGHPYWWLVMLRRLPCLHGKSASLLN